MCIWDHLRLQHMTGAPRVCKLQSSPVVTIQFWRFMGIQKTHVGCIRIAVTVRRLPPSSRGLCDIGQGLRLHPIITVLKSLKKHRISRVSQSYLVMKKYFSRILCSLWTPDPHQLRCWWNNLVITAYELVQDFTGSLPQGHFFVWSSNRFLSLQKPAKIYWKWQTVLMICMSNTEAFLQSREDTEIISVRPC